MKTLSPVLLLLGIVGALGCGSNTVNESQAQAAANEAPSDTISAAFPFASRYVDVLGSTMHYIDEGEGDPILFLHGNPDHMYVWRNVIPHAAQVGRALAVDLIGMGGSDVPDIDYRFFDHARYLEAFIEALDLKNITLVVHDWGGSLGFRYARRHEDNVKGLIFMEVPVGKPFSSWDEFPETAREIFQQFRTPEVGWNLIVEQNVMGDGPRTIRPLSEEERGRHVAPLAEKARRKPVWRFVNEISVAGEPADVHEEQVARRAWLQQTALPKLLFHTNPGLIVTADAVMWSRQHLKNLEAVEVGPGFHYPQEENPHLIGKELVKWYRGL